MQQPLIFAAVGGLVLILVAVVIIILSRGRKKSGVDNRLTTYAGISKEGDVAVTNINATREQVNARIEKAIAGRGFATVMARNLAQADVRLTVAEFLGAKVASAALGFAVGIFFGRQWGLFSVIAGILVAVIFLYIPDFLVKRKAKKRIKAFNNQLGDTITLAANSLRSGYSLLQSLELISRESAPPISEEFARVIREVSLGLTTREALGNMLRRVPSEDLDLLITAVNIQSEVGGNLAQILDSIGHTIRERVRIKGEIQVLTAQQQYAGYIISGLPVALALVLYLISPSYMNKMFEWPYICMPICGVILIIAGFFAIKKIVDIDI